MNDTPNEEDTGAAIDALVDELLEVLDGKKQGDALSAFGRIIGCSASNWVDLVQRCNAVTEMSALVYHELNGPTEH